MDRGGNERQRGGTKGGEVVLIDRQTGGWMVDRLGRGKTVREIEWRVDIE